MRKTAQTFLMALGLIGCLAMPLSASAVTYEDSFTNCDYPKTFDLIVMRPVSFLTLGLGSILFVPVGTLAALTVPEDFPYVYDTFVGKPARFTFRRPLGECQAIDTTL